MGFGQELQEAGKEGVIELVSIFDPGYLLAPVSANSAPLLGRENAGIVVAGMEVLPEGVVHNQILIFAIEC